MKHGKKGSHGHLKKGFPKGDSGIRGAHSPNKGSSMPKQKNAKSGSYGSGECTAC